MMGYQAIRYAVENGRDGQVPLVLVRSIQELREIM